MSNHQKFLQHLDSSSESVFIVAKFLYLKGFDVKISGLSKAERHSDWKKHKDDGDLFLYHKGKEHRIEVKGLSCDFTGKGDWVFSDFIVCAKHSFDNAIKKPLAYFILNKDRTHAAIVKSITKNKWRVVTRSDHRYENVTQEFYVCPFECINWIKLNN